MFYGIFSPTIIIYLMIICMLNFINAQYESEHFSEKLILKSLPGGQISAHFQFKTFIHYNDSYSFGATAAKNNDIFPLPLLHLFHQMSIDELHFSLTKGFWKYDRWGLPTRDTSPSAHLWIWFSDFTRSKEYWTKLTSILSGQFCASVNLIKPTVTLRPRISFRSFLKLNSSNNGNEHNYCYLASLPQEAICTENLTPFLKTLPCQQNKGLGSLLQATNVFDSQFFSMSIDFLPYLCSGISSCDMINGIELKQNIITVFNAPLILDGKYSWTLNSLFGSSSAPPCPLSSSSHIYVDITPLNWINGSRLTMEPTRYLSIDMNQENKISLSQSMINDSIWEQKKIYAEYDLKKIFKEPIQNNSAPKKSINFGIHYSKSFSGKLPYQVNFNQIQVRRHSRGVGVSTGGITVLLTNKLPFDVEAIYLDAIPWYLRMYLHTLRIETKTLNENSLELLKQIHPIELFYEPAQDRARPHHLEIKLRLPQKSLTEICFEFDHQFLSWSEFPPDPNRGLYINPATITITFDELNFINSFTYERFLPQIFESSLNSSSPRILLDSKLNSFTKQNPLRLFTEPLIILMPTPDFSMPYNVICLVSTALSIAFGPIYNLTTRRVKVFKKPTQQPKRKRFIIF